MTDSEAHPAVQDGEPVERGVREPASETPGAAPPAAAAPPDGDLRLAATILLLGGILLTLLSLYCSGFTTGGERLACYGLAAAGLLAFLLGGKTAGGGELPAALERLLRKPAALLDSSYGQLFLLLLAPAFALLARFAAGDELLARSAPASLLAWLLALLCVTWGALGPERLRAVRLARSDVLFTAAIFAAALLLRGLGTEAVPSTLSGDEGAAGLTAAQFASGEANNLFTIGWFDFPSLYFALQSVGVSLLGHTIPALRLPSAVGGALTVVALYWLARVTFDATLARIASLVLLFSHYHIHMSRIGLNNIWDGFFAALAAAGLWYGWRADRRLGFVLAGLSLGLGQYFYVTMRAMPLVFLVWAAAAFLGQRALFRRRLPGLALSAYVALVAVLPLALFFSTHPAQLTSRSNFVTIFGDWMAGQTAGGERSVAGVLLDQALLAAGGLVNEPLRLLYEPGAPLLLAVGAALFLMGLLWALANMDLRYFLLLLPIAATLLIVTISQSAPSSQRYVLATPFVALFVALPAGLLAVWLRQLWPEYRALAAVPALLLVAAICFTETRFYFTEAYDAYILGGVNTAVASELAAQLQQEETPPEVLFYGPPRMGYRSHGTLPFLAPDVQGIDVEAGALFPEGWNLSRRTLFVFLPERLDALPAVREAFPGGSYAEREFDDEHLLYAVYAVRPGAP